MSEDILKRQCRKIANEFKREHPDDFWFYCPTDKFYSGIPDILCCYKGRWGAAELKTPKGKVTQLQAHTISEIQKAGGIVAVPRSAQDFRDFLIQLKGGENNE